MMYKVLLEKPKKEVLKALTYFGLILAIISMPLVMILLQMSNFAGTLEEAQLGFNGAYIKSLFALMNESEMSLFILANIIDYGFMVAYGTLFFSLATSLTRKFSEDSIWSKSGRIIAILGILSACCDGMENVFLLSMALDPVGFPAWLAIPHSSFALAKFTLMYLVFGWILATGIARLIMKIKN